MNSLGAGAGPTGYTTLIVHWFDRRRGIALGISLSGLGLGTAVMPRLAQGLILEYGWNVFFAVLGGFCLLVTVPIVLLVLREHPGDMGLVPDGAIETSGNVQGCYRAVGNKLPRSKLPRYARLRYAKRGIDLYPSARIVPTDNHYEAFDIYLPVL